tara:strand:+ start:1077 stop:1241 length:165 start_codon:yes stop_codon:yes gene_type:complete
MDNDPHLQLMNELKTIRKEIKELDEKLDRHISFIESVYRGLRHPIDRVKTWFGG